MQDSGSPSRTREALPPADRATASAPPAAALKVASDLVDEGVISKERRCGARIEPAGSTSCCTRPSTQSRPGARRQGPAGFAGRGCGRDRLRRRHRCRARGRGQAPVHPGALRAHAGRHPRRVHRLGHPHRPRRHDLRTPAVVARGMGKPSWPAPRASRSTRRQDPHHRQTLRRGRRRERSTAPPARSTAPSCTLIRRRSTRTSRTSSVGRAGAHARCARQRRDSGGRLRKARELGAEGIGLCRTGAHVSSAPTGCRPSAR